MEYIRKIDIELDREYINYISVRQNDSARALLFHLHTNGTDYKLLNRTVRAWGVKPDGTKVFIDLEVVNASKGECKLRLTNNILAKVGELRLMLTIAESEDILSTSPISIDIKESLRDDEAVESTNEFTALENGLKSVDMWNTYFEKTSGNIEEKYTDRLNATDKKIEETKNGVNRLSYLSTSNIISNTYTPTDLIYQHMKWQGINQALIIMVKMINSTDVNPTIMNDSRVINCIKKANSYGVKTVMLKPHLGVNWSDSTKRYNLDFGANTNEFLANWKTILLNYAEICNNNDIPVLCIGCEQAKMVTNKYKDSWDDIISSIKVAYPKLLLTYAFDSGSGIMNDDNCIFTSDIDFVGLNLYPRWYTEVYSNSLTYKDLMPSAYNSYAPWKNGFSFSDRISEIYNKFGKKTYITEIGLMPYDDGLVTLISEYADDKEAQRNYNVPALAYESIFNTFAKNPYVVGIALWATKHPFCYFDYESETITYSEAERVIKKYIEGGELV